MKFLLDGITMKIISTGMIFCIAVSACAADARDYENKDKPMCRDSLNYVKLSDSKTFTLRTPLLTSPERRQTVEVQGILEPKGQTFYKEGAIWKVPITTVDYRLGAQYYALFKEIEDHILIFALWNGWYFIIDKKTGQILKKDEGDDVLLEYAELVPLKLAVITPQEGRMMTKQELEEFEKLEAETEKRERNAVKDIRGN